MEEVRYQNMWTFLTESNYEELADVDADMKCSICTRILINAHRSTSCGCTYCLDCVRTYLGGERKFCPVNMQDCQLEALDIGRNILPDHAINYRISKLIVGCRYSCGFRCELRSMEEHERTCRRRPVSCPYANVGCTETQLVSTSSIQDHLVSASGLHAALLVACTDRLQGENCSMQTDVDELRSEVTNLRNENTVVKNENTSLKAAVRRHHSCLIGLFLLITCGCALVSVSLHHLSEKLGQLERQAQDIELLARGTSDEVRLQARGEMEELRRNTEAGLKQQASAHGQLEMRVSEMGASVEMRHRREFVWLIDGWAAKSQSAREGGQTMLESDGFYSHEHGYRMRIYAYPDGEGAGKGTHLSVFFHVMQGPFDNFLSWPFKLNMTLSITNQRTGHDHVTTTAVPGAPPNSTWLNRPKYEKGEGLGKHKLVELAELSSTAGLVQDDTVSIRCVVKSDTYQ